MADAENPAGNLKRVETPAGRAPLPMWKNVERLSAQIRERVVALPVNQRVWLGVSVAVLLAVAGGLGWLALRPQWRVLYSGMESRDARQVETQLAAAGIRYDTSADGTTLSVPAEQLDKARLAIAAKGLPQSGRMGFEIFDKPNWVGSEFDERVNYQRALEGELEHTIGTLGSVESARVHLVLPHDSLFTDEQRAAKASVVLKLKHHALSEEEAESIRNLVANAVDNLHPDGVTLADADGRVQLGAKNGRRAAAEYEQALADKLIATLEPVAGRDNVRATVNVEFETASVDDMQEVYDPQAAVPLTSQKSEQTSGGQAKPVGIPGTASNAPNTSGTAQPPLFPQQVTGPESTKQESNTYAVSKHVKHTQDSPLAATAAGGLGRVRRVAAAILVNDREVRSKDGKQTSWQPRTAEEMQRMRQLVAAVVGSDAGRGDVVTVEEMSFASNAGEAPAPLAQRLLDTAGGAANAMRTGLLILVVAVVLLFVVRPMMRQLKTALLAPQLLGAGAGGGALAAGIAGAEELDETETLSFERQQARGQALFDEVAARVRNEPKQSARMLQSWINAGEKA